MGKYRTNEKEKNPIIRESQNQIRVYRSEPTRHSLLTTRFSKTVISAKEIVKSLQGPLIRFFTPDTGFQPFLRLLRFLVMTMKRAQFNSGSRLFGIPLPVIEGREYLIKCILMRVPIENGSGFINQGIRFY